MKKILCILLCIILCLLVSACEKITDENGVERNIEYGLIEVGKVSGNGYSVICYDPATKICYLVVSVPYKYGISPYYIINESGEPEIAVYGVNYIN